jgi:glycosyltransferase involved in cell wall biosynthesis
LSSIDAVAPVALVGGSTGVRPTEAAVPLVSIIVPTYNRARTLPFLFDALGRQIYPASRIELIVVDNSSADDTELVVKRWASALPFPVSFYRKDNHGPAASRNYGAARARGQVLAYTDSDCRPDPAWLRNGVRGFNDGVGVVCGPFLKAGEMLTSAGADGMSTDTGIYPTANLLVARNAFESVGGFDERFGVYPWGDLVAGEDTDFAWRVKRTGLKAIFAKDVVVGHLTTPVPWRRWILRPVVLQIIPRLLRTIPELRRMALWKRYFVTKTRLYFDLALVGAIAALASRSLLPLLLAVPWGYWIYSIREGFARDGIALTLGRLLFLHYLFLASTIVLVVGSIRYRRVVL